MLLSEIKKKALNLANGLELLDFGFALPYTWVLIEGPEGKSLGVAMTLPEEVQRYTNSISEPSIEAFIERIDSLNVIERTLGIAAVNAVSQYHLDVSDLPDVDVVELVEGFSEVAVIGNMPPVVRALREKGVKTLVFERNPKLWDRETLSDALEYILLPEVEAVIVSGSALVNGTLEMILDRAKKAELVILTGPTAQIHQELVKGTGITHLAAMKVIDLERALLGLKLGSFRGFEKGNRKYVVEVP
ncbi:hypothetical protein, conserved, DUF364 family [Thermococcus kodakarensis KOD1]|uniref:Heavy-metal chelation domain-containing protein n=1 Tax=Thermococcus kodakarensis (strain ATCC BAA-918 / JCM 12380 / KOD1) TaxID=69014 RepID=Q5JG54_THEKO|nr:DUF364 domain-containing protein [Thermococcus kodakarensis]WCN28738.1 DUF364 domain-containing protein [Thermococcus kodakarensis]WCN31035.1 DUF364 domain-containing protein [Thermococcus kodakarensis]BAD84899.1 hypothetical protein, conserved, DUF364 family [Thermococcus kodakarensis KOD1]